MKTVVGITDSRQKAYEAAKYLRDQGFTNEISIVWRHVEKDEDKEQEPAGFRTGYDDNLWDGGATGASLGALGGLLTGGGLIGVPVLGPLAAVGPIAGLLTGSVAGGLAGAVADWGISPEGGRDIEEALTAGKTVLFVQCSNNEADSTANLLKQHSIEQVAIH